MYLDFSSLSLTMFWKEWGEPCFMQGLTWASASAETH